MKQYLYGMLGAVTIVVFLVVVGAGYVLYVDHARTTAMWDFLNAQAKAQTQDKK